MKAYLLLALMPFSLCATNLGTLINQAHSNELIDMYKSKVISASKTYDATKSSYFPRIDFGGSAQLISPKDALGAGQIYNVNAEASVIVLDGFKRENILDEKTKLRHASEFDLSQIRKDLSFQVAGLYFNLQIVQADIKALEQTKEQLQEQLKQQRKFFNARLTTEDNVVRIEAAVANVDYRIEVERYKYDESMAKLYTLTNSVVEKVEKSSLVAPTFESSQELDRLKALASNVEAVGFQAEQVDSSYYPTIVLRDKYGYTGYEDDALDELGIPGVERINTQNVLMLTLSMNVIDFSSASEQKEAVMAQKRALESQLAYQRKEANADMKLAKRAIERSKTLLKASELSQDASNRTFEIVEKKYKARVVDYVKYLDALTQKTEAQAQYNRAVGALEISYASYYYYAGFDVKEYVK